MTSRLLMAGVAAGCMAAAGVGGYLAVRTTTYTSDALAAADAAPLTIAAPAPVDSSVASAAAPEVPKPAAPKHTGARPAPAAPAASPVAPATRTATTDAPAASRPIPALEIPTSAPGAFPVHPGRPVELPAPTHQFVELPAKAVIGIRLDTTVSTASARVEDPVRARVTRPVVVDGVTVVPVGTRLDGVVTEVETGGRFRERSRIGVRFTSLRIDNRQVRIQTETIYREGEPAAGEATAKTGASAVVGAILGGVIGGRKGAAIGAATGAAGGTAMVATGGPNEATLASGSTFTLRLIEPATLQVD